MHAYRYEEHSSTFIVETTEETWRRAGLDGASEDETVAFTEKLFARELGGHPVLKNRSLWRSFPTVQNARWHHDNVVLLGDAAHTAHFSIGSGTKLAMEDSIALARALGEHRDLRDGARRLRGRAAPSVETLQRAAQTSLEWFEQTERYHGRLEPPQFAFSLLTRSLRISHENLKARDAPFVATVDRWFAEPASRQSGVRVAGHATAAADVHAVPAARVRAAQSRRGLADVPVLGGGRHARRLAPGPPRQPRGGRRRARHDRDDRREPRGPDQPGCTGMYKPEHVEAWKRIVDFVHGTQPGPDRPAARARRPQGLDHAAVGGHRRAADDGQLADRLGLAVPYFPHSQVPREMDRADMDRVRDDFVRAAGMAVQAGFDLLELHVAHGYLLASFLSPLTNRRTDGYGGSLAQRLRFPLEVFDAVRAVWPAARPMSVRLSATDWKDGGLEPAEAVEVARALRARGCDVIDVSAGQTVPDQRPAYGRLFQTPFSDRDPPRGGHPHDDGRRHRLVRRRQLDPRRRPRRPLRARARPPLRSRTGPTTPPASRASTCRGPISTRQCGLSPRAATSRLMKKAHLLRWRPRPHAQRTGSTPRVRPRAPPRIWTFLISLRLSGSR